MTLSPPLPSREGPGKPTALAVGHRTTPGLVDLQVNGFGGVDFNDQALDAPALDHALDRMARTGVLACLPTLITAHTAQLEARLAALEDAVARSTLGPLMVPGYHLEGPFLNPGAGFAGCHDPAAMRHPDLPWLQRLVAGLRRPIRLLTLAPELPGAAPLIAWAVAHGIAVAIGHADASPDAVHLAADAGATLSTHLGNGLPATLPKLENPLMAQLAEDRLTACLIADGLHVPPATLRVMARAKGSGRTILVTDAVAAADAPPGSYAFAGQAILAHPDGTVRNEQGRLAGSALTLDRAVQNAVAWGLGTPAETMAMASANPAARLGLTPPGAIVWDGLRSVCATLHDRTWRAA